MRVSPVAVAAFHVHMNKKVSNDPVRVEGLDEGMSNNLAFTVSTGISDLHISIL